MAKASRRKSKDAPKPKRPGPKAWTSANPQVVTDLSGMSAYRQPPPRRHRGPSTAKAVAGTGKVSASSR